MSDTPIPVPEPVPTPDTGHGDPPKKPPSISQQEGIGGA